MDTNRHELRHIGGSSRCGRVSLVTRHSSLLLAFLLACAFAAPVSAQTTSTLNPQLSTNSTGWGKGGKPKPTPKPSPTPAPTPKPVDGETDWNGTTNSNFNTGS